MVGKNIEPERMTGRILSEKQIKTEIERQKERKYNGNKKKTKENCNYDLSRGKSEIYVIINDL